MSGNPIRFLPNMPQEAVRAANQGKLAFLLGAGVSRLAGCIGWGELAKRVVAECARTVSAAGTPLLTLEQRQLLGEDNDHRRVISVCHQLMKAEDRVDRFFQHIALPPDTVDLDAELVPVI